MKNALFAGLALITLAACGGDTVQTPPASAKGAEATLDAYYTSAAEADFETWIAQFTDDARFYGTDATEDWPIAEVAEGIEESFAEGNGWDFEILDRRVTVAPGGQIAWFAELAHFANTDYTLRPTGVLVNQNG